MKHSQATQGSTFVILLDDGDILHEKREEFARAHAINAATLIAIGGADIGSKLVVGPEEGRGNPITLMEYVLANIHEIAGVGAIFPDKDHNPVLHMHIASGRKESTIIGCVRKGVKIWHIMEVTLIELIGTSARHIFFDKQIGFELLEL
jgi:predicted DNA-binding protein with PD1-like motif